MPLNKEYQGGVFEIKGHDSIELKDLWLNSRNIDSMFFATATFSAESKPSFSSPITHFIIAKFKNTEKTQKEFSKYIKDQPIFVFDVENIIFERGSEINTNFSSSLTKSSCLNKSLLQ